MSDVQDASSNNISIRSHSKASGSDPSGTSNSDSTIIHKVDYRLNKNKSITKKIRACEREHEIIAEYKTGNIILTIQGGLYEIMKLTIQRLYSDHPIENKRIVPKVSIEKSKNYETACTYTVFENGEKVYVVNLYHTQSKIMINGKKELDFLNKDIPLIAEIMNSLEDFYGKGTIGTLNTLIKNILFSMNKETTKDQPDNGKCPCVVCRRNVLTNAIQCHTCHQWVHYRCDKLQQDMIQIVSDPENMYLYRCKTCEKAISESVNIITYESPSEAESITSHENSHITKNINTASHKNISEPEIATTHANPYINKTTSDTTTSLDNSTEQKESQGTVSDIIHDLVSSVVDNHDNSELELVITEQPILNTEGPIVMEENPDNNHQIQNNENENTEIYKTPEQPPKHSNKEPLKTLEHDREPEPNGSNSQDEAKMTENINSGMPDPTENQETQSKVTRATPGVSRYTDSTHTNTYRNSNNTSDTNIGENRNETNIIVEDSHTNNKNIISTITDVIKSLDHSMCLIAEHIVNANKPKENSNETVLQSIESKLSELVSNITQAQENEYETSVTVLENIDCKLSTIADSVCEIRNYLIDNHRVKNHNDQENTIEHRLSQVEKRLSLIESGGTTQKIIHNEEENVNNQTGQNVQKPIKEQNQNASKVNSHDKTDTVQSKVNEKNQVKSSTNSKAKATKTNANENTHRPGEMKNVRKFRGKDDPLSNLYMGQNKIKVDNVFYIASEQYYQSESAKHHKMYDLKEKIEASNNTRHIFNISKNITVNKEWNQRKRAVMKKVLIQKYLYVPEFRESLKDSGSATIIEDTYDPYWGGLGGGLNVMGELLMEIRANPPLLSKTPLEQVPNEQRKSVLCLMDSNGYNVDFRRTLPRHHTKVRKCPTIEKAIETVHDETGPEPYCILIHTGTNNLINDDKPADLYIDLTTEIKKKWPNARLVISKLLPRGGSKLNKKLKMFNNIIENNFLFDTNADIIDHSDLLWGENPNHYYYLQEQKQGRVMPLLHLNNQGLANLASKFRYALKNLQ